MKITIIGAGLGGLTFGALAARDGHQVEIYDKNRNILYDALTEYGYELARPDGAFYLFMKSPEENANAFCERAKKYEILIVPGDDFGFKGYVRISYCVSTEMILKSLDGFKKLIEEKLKEYIVG